MAQIRPVSDLRNKFTDISNLVHTHQENVILTKNGYADMVVMSYEAYNCRLFENEVFTKLMEAEVHARVVDRRLSHEHVFDDLRAIICEEGAMHGL